MQGEDTTMTTPKKNVGHELDLPDTPAAKRARVPQTVAVSEAALFDVPKDLQGLYTYRDESGDQTFTFEDIDRLLASPEQRAEAQRKWDQRKKVPPMARPPQLDQASRGTTEQAIRDALQKAGIKVVERNSMLKLPPLGPVPDKWKGEPVNWREFIGITIPGYDKPVVDEMPVLNALKSDWVTPVWMPRYIALQYEAEVLDDIAVFATSPHLPPETRNLLYDLRASCVEVVSKYYCGNGSVEGQVGRLKKVMAVADQLALWNSTPGVYKRRVTPHEYSAFKELMDKRFPLNRPGLALNGTPSEIRKRNEALGKGPITSVDARSSDGQIWRSRPGTNRSRPEGRHRGEVAPWDSILADRLIMVLGHDYYDDREKIESDFEYLRVSTMKNKTEVYELAERTTKTRNYFETNGFAMLPLQLVYKATHVDLRRWDTEPDDSPVQNIIGWSPYGGGMNRILRKMARNERYAFVYADNLWTTAIDEKTGQRVSISMDMDKGEANVQFNEVLFENRRSMEQFSDASAAWKRYLTVLAPMMSRASVAVFGALQIVINFLISGTIATAYYNQVKVIRYLDAATELLRDRRQEDFTVSGSELGPILKLAQEVGGALWKIEASELYENIVHPKPGVVIRVDLLGMDAVYLGNYGVDAFAPVLNKERLLKALMWFKRDAKRSYPGELLNIVKYIRFRAFYMLGGWLYPDLAAFLRMKCERMLHYLRNVAEIPEAVFEGEVEILLDSLGIDRSDPSKAALAGSLAPLLKLRAVPLPYEAVEFACGGAAAAQFAVWVQGNPTLRATIQNWLPDQMVPEQLRKPKEEWSPVVLAEHFLASLSPVVPGSEAVLPPGRLPKVAVPRKLHTQAPYPNPLMGSFMSRARWDDLPESERRALITRVAAALLQVLGGDPDSLKKSILLVRMPKSSIEIGISPEVELANQLSGAMAIPQASVVYALRALGLSKDNYETSPREGLVDLLAPATMAALLARQSNILEAAPTWGTPTGRTVMNM